MTSLINNVGYCLRTKDHSGMETALCRSGSACTKGHGGLDQECPGLVELPRWAVQFQMPRPEDG